MERHPARRTGFTIVDAMAAGVVLLLAVVLVGLLLPWLNTGHPISREMQNSTQLRGIHQGMFTYAQSNKTGGGDGFYPGLDAAGLSIPVGVPTPMGVHDPASGLTGYAAAASDRVLPGEMNAGPARGFLVTAFAELAAGDFLPGGGTAYFLNPADTVKAEFNPKSGAPLTAANISYTVLDVSRGDGGVHPLMAEWKETLSTQAILLADRAVGDGSDPLTRSSVWTTPGSGDWWGGVVRNDGSTSFEVSPGGRALGLKYGKHVFTGGDTLNFFSDTFTLAPGTPGAPGAAEITPTSGILYDEADGGADPHAF